MKTNMDYLRDCIEGNDEAIEFWNEVSKEIEGLQEEINDLGIIKEELDQKNDIIENLEDKLYNVIKRDDLEIINCGIGVIRYEEPDNLKLQTIMEELKEKLEHEAKFGTAPILLML